MGRVNLLAANELVVIIGGGSLHGRVGRVPSIDPQASRPARQCLVCQQPHQHNNAFCSASCCRIYKSRTGQH